ncbi:acetyltransferase [Streptomyces zinciresistens K42]|uniref:Acetyltransferase n=1 Tax=Streptomyces zinciresistens K42 TaxID=700597 RepID=G2G9I0_9ACTN|nr:acetyltransferase [Streptomyces zinciresistens K42]
MGHRHARGGCLGRALLATAEDAAVRAGITLLHLDTGSGSPAERLYGSAGWTRAGVVPGCAAVPDGAPRPTTLSCKHLGPPAAAG